MQHPTFPRVKVAAHKSRKNANSTDLARENSVFGDSVGNSAVGMQHPSFPRVKLAARKQTENANLTADSAEGNSGFVNDLVGSSSVGIQSPCITVTGSSKKSSYLPRPRFSRVKVAAHKSNKLFPVPKQLQVLRKPLDKGKAKVDDDREDGSPDLCLFRDRVGMQHPTFTRVKVAAHKSRKNANSTNLAKENSVFGDSVGNSDVGLQHPSFPRVKLAARKQSENTNLTADSAEGNSGFVNDLVGSSSVGIQSPCITVTGSSKKSSYLPCSRFSRVKVAAHKSNKFFHVPKQLQVLRKPLDKGKAKADDDREHGFPPVRRAGLSSSLGFRSARMKVRRRIDLRMNLTIPTSSSSRDLGREGMKVRELLREFNLVCRKLERQNECNPGKVNIRVDCVAWNELKKKCINQGKDIIVPFPGVEVGDVFRYRWELFLIGLHCQQTKGIAVGFKGKSIALSVVASGGYDDKLDESDMIVYTGEGGKPTKTKSARDQQLVDGNRALMNSMELETPVRVIRGDVRFSDFAGFVYDGLYKVESFWKEIGPEGKQVYKFRMVRIPGQQELVWKTVIKARKSKVREGLCVADISQGKESTPIRAVNTIDDEKPPSFNYITQMTYPDKPTCGRCCDCPQGCSKFSQCSCVEKNGGEMPYNHTGVIVEMKDLVYECGLCNCPPSCYNRVSQKGIKLELEIFKTESRGWGVRSLNSIPSGTFICEYVGELLEDDEVHRRINDEYMFEIGGHRGNGEGDSSNSGYLQGVEDSNFTIDAAKYGNVGRFINHSCSPNLEAQNVLYDHGDPRMAHIMLFAVKNILPLQELTFDYNYQLGKVCDSHGNIKMKFCFCGSAECRGRMY